MKTKKLKRIAKLLQGSCPMPPNTSSISVEHFATTASTNTLLLHGNDGVNRLASPPPPYTIVSADTQSAGHGRSGRSWSSAKGQGVYMSISLPPFPNQLQPSPITRLNIFAGYRLCENLRRIGIPANLKWPNDIIVHNKKIGGVLLETTYRNNTTATMVLGVGLNVNQSAKQMAQTTNTSQGISMRATLGRRYNIYDAYKVVASSILEAYTLCSQPHGKGSDPMVERWGDYSQNLGKEIMFTVPNSKHRAEHRAEHTPSGKIAVIEEGITPEGYIITTDKDANRHTYTYGEVGYSALD